MAAYEVKLQQFEGPLDLLLHLVQKNEMDIQEIKIAQITAQYLGYLELMKAQNMDVASEFLVMAATLLHLKSRTLLPPARNDVEDEHGEDPEEELKARLLEYKRYKEGAQKLEDFPRLYRDVFPRPSLANQGVDYTDVAAAQVEIDISIYDLVKALQKVLQPRPVPPVHVIHGSKLTVVHGMSELLARLRGQTCIDFQQCFHTATSRLEVVVQFMALLELARLQLVGFEQHFICGTIYVHPGEDIRNGRYEGLEHIVNVEEYSHG